jgi:tight adherence protein C
MLIFLLLGLLLVVACALLVARAVALPHVRATKRLESLAEYGFAARATSEEPARRAAMGLLDDMARALGAAFAGRANGLTEAQVRRELMAAGLHQLSPSTFIGYRVLAAAVAPALLVWMASSTGMSGAMVLLGVPVLLVCGWVAPLTFVRRRARERMEQIDYGLPELVDLLVVTVESGMGFAGSMQMAAERFTGPLGDELRLALQEQAMGLPVDQSLEHMLVRADTEGMRSFVRSIRQGESLGVSIGQIMRDLATDMRQRRRAAAEQRAQKAPIKILFPLVTLIFPAIFVVILAPGIISIASSYGGGS